MERWSGGACQLPACHPALHSTRTLQKIIVGTIVRGIAGRVQQQLFEAKISKFTSTECVRTMPLDPNASKMPPWQKICHQSSTHRRCSVVLSHNFSNWCYRTSKTDRRSRTYCHLHRQWINNVSSSRIEAGWYCGGTKLSLVLFTNLLLYLLDVDADVRGGFASCCRVLQFIYMCFRP